jgi:hypothetical protein
MCSFDCSLSLITPLFTSKDNGAKLVEPLGEMLLQSWEGYATEITNVAEEKLPEMIASLIAAEAIDTSVEAQVVIARDTRYGLKFSDRDQDKSLKLSILMASENQARLSFSPLRMESRRSGSLSPTMASSRPPSSITSCDV